MNVYPLAMAATLSALWETTGATATLRGDRVCLLVEGVVVWSVPSTDDALSDVQRAAREWASEVLLCNHCSEEREWVHG